MIFVDFADSVAVQLNEKTTRESILQWKSAFQIETNIIEQLIFINIFACFLSLSLLLSAILVCRSFICCYFVFYSLLFSWRYNSRWFWSTHSHTQHSQRFHPWWLKNCTMLFARDISSFSVETLLFHCCCCCRSLALLLFNSLLPLIRVFWICSQFFLFIPFSGCVCVCWHTQCGCNL